MRVGVKNQRERRAGSCRPPATDAASAGGPRFVVAETVSQTDAAERVPLILNHTRSSRRVRDCAPLLRIRLGMVRNSAPYTTASEGLQSPVCRTQQRRLADSAPNLQSSRAFTLVELMAVIVVICVLVGALIGVAKYANRQIGITRVKAQMAALQLALEAYKADMGYYPASTWVRYSGYDEAELSNSACLYRALTQSKRYYNARKVDIGVTGQYTFFIDPWGTAWNYYRPALPQPTSLIVCNGPGDNSYAWGNQHNPLTYDLYSFGPDKTTSIPGANPNNWAFSVGSTGRDTDDIVNWKR